MRVLVACEESQAVCTAFRERGHDAYSCDIQPCSGGHPEWHITGGAGGYLNPCFYEYEGKDNFGIFPFITGDFVLHQIKRWDLIIAHPPCTYLSSVGASRLFNATHQVKNAEREREGWKARDFFQLILDAECDKICVENPAPLKHFKLPKYTQIIEPYQFGHPWKKRTCLWLKGLPPLVPTEIVEPTGCWVIEGGGSTCRVKLKSGNAAKSAKERSKTFLGIARAMAEQWG